jgi:hypothetical protein
MCKKHSAMTNQCDMNIKRLARNVLIPIRLLDKIQDRF